MEDLRDLATNGLDDLFEYGQEFMVGGNALGDNSKKNETAEDKKKEETFQEKYRRELQKDFDDLVKEDEEEPEEPTADSDETAEPEAPQLNLEDLMNDEDEPEDAGADSKGEATAA